MLYIEFAGGAENAEQKRKRGESRELSPRVIPQVIARFRRTAEES